MMKTKERITILLLPLLVSLTLSCGDNVLSKLASFIPNRAPKILSLTSDSPGADALLPGLPIHVQAKATDADKNKFTYEYSSPLGIFTSQKDTGDSSSVTFITPEGFDSHIDIVITLKVTDSKNKSATKTLNIGSGKKGPILTWLNTVNEFLKANDKRTINWQADKNGIYQVRLLSLDEPCEAKEELAFQSYTEKESKETSFYGPSFAAAPNNILSVGENRICIVVQDSLLQIGTLEILLTVDNVKPLTSISPEPAYYSVEQDISLSCEDTTSSCRQTIYTITTDGTVPADPEFNEDGSIKTGLKYDSVLSVLHAANSKVTTIKYRSIDEAGNIEDIKSDSYIVDTNPTVLEVLSNEHENLSVGMPSYSTSSKVQWTSSTAGLEYKLYINAVDCSGLGSSSSGSGSAGTTSLASMQAVIQASDLLYGVNTIRICTEVFTGAYVYKTVSITRYEEVSFALSSSDVDEGAVVAQLDVNLSAALAEDVNLTYSIDGGTASSLLDYTLQGDGSILFSAGDTNKKITFTIEDDTLIEDDETIMLSIDSVSGAGLASVSTHTLHIIDNEGLPNVYLSATGSTNIAEAGQSVELKASITNTVNEDISVNFSLTGTATGGGIDYTSTSASVIIASGTLSNTITITSVDDADDEGTEIVVVNIDSVTNSEIAGGSQSVSVNILDDDQKGPLVQNAYYCDTNANAKLDHVMLVFDKALDDSTFDGFVNSGSPDNRLHNTTTAWQVAGHSGIKLDTRDSIITSSDNPCGVLGAGDSTDDNTLWLAFSEISEGYNTGEKPDITTSNSILKSQDGCFLGSDSVSCAVHSEDITTVDISEEDKASPAIASINASVGSNLVIVNFSEAADSNGGASCDSLLTKDDFVYFDVSNNAASIISSIQDANACDDNKISLLLDVSLTAEDLASDNIAVVSSSSIYDIVGNVASSNLHKSFSANKGPVLHFSMDSQTYGDNNTTVQDQSGNGIDGTVNGALITNDMSDKMGGAYSFDGVDDYIEIASTEKLQFSGEITMCAWIKPTKLDTSGFHKIIGNGLQGNIQNYLRINNGQYEVGSYAGSAPDFSAKSSVSPTDIGVWVHLCGLYDGASWRLYKNGILLASTGNNTRGAISTADTWFISKWVDGNLRPFKGKMDDVRIYDYAISLEQIKLLAAKVPDGLIAYYPLDGDTKDYSGNYNHGVATALTSSNNRFVDSDTSYDFNGSTSTIVVPVSSTLNLAGSSLTMAAWAKRDTGTNSWDCIMGKGESGVHTALHFCFDSSTDKLRCSFGGVGAGSTLDTEKTHTDSLWHHYTCTYNASSKELSIYKDGTKTDSLISSSDFLSNVNNLGIGYAGYTADNQRFHGSLDDVRLYNRLLSAGEVKALGSEVNRDLVAWYPLDGDADDYSGNANNGSEQGGVSSAGVDRFGNANSSYIFDGIDDYIEIADDNSLDLHIEYTLAAWIKPNSLGDRRIIDKVTEGWDDGFLLDTYPDKLRFVFKNVISKSNTSLQIDKWQHVLITYSTANKEVQFFINGIFDSSVAISTPTPQNNLSLMIGKSSTNSSNYFDGLLDDVRLYKRVLSPTEVKELAGNINDGLVAYYPFNGNANDESGSGNDGTVYGAALVPDRFGNANSSYSFDGMNDYILVDDYPKSSSAFSLSVWYYNNGNSMDTIIKNWGESSSVGQFHLEINSGQLRLQVGKTANPYYDYIQEESVFPINTWQHIAALANGTTIHLYRNGVEVSGIAEHSSPLPQTESSLLTNFNCMGIGVKPNDACDGPAATSARWSSGKIDEVRLYNRPLSLGEIRQLSGFNPRQLDGLHTWFSADSGVYKDDGSTFSSDGEEAANWNDISGNGYKVSQVINNRWPTFIADGGVGVNHKPVIRFDNSTAGEEDYLVETGTAIPEIQNSITVFAVTSTDAIVAGGFYPQIVSHTSEGNDGWNLYWDGDVSNYARFITKITDRGWLADYASFEVTPSTHTYYILAAWRDTRIKRIFSNGKMGVEVNTDGIAAIDYSADATFMIAAKTGGAYLNGDIAEIITYDRALNDIEMAQVQCYLASKYALTLDASVECLNRDL